ncbi:MAG: hypothetical protein ACREKL_06995 [Chthoniobacterales bacterium]
MRRFLLTLALTALSLPAHATQQDNPFFDLSGDFRGRIVIEVATREAVSMPAELYLNLGGRKSLMEMELSANPSVYLTPVSNTDVLFPFPFRLDWRFNSGNRLRFGNFTVGDYRGVYHLGKQGFQFSLSQSSSSPGQIGPDHVAVGTATVQWNRHRKYLVLDLKILSSTGETAVAIKGRLSKPRTR